MKITLEKYHESGNDYLVFDPNKNILKLSQENVKLICDRYFSAGSNDILEEPILEGEKMEVRIWNPGGSIAEESGNGVRILVKYLKGAGYVQETYVTLSTLAGDVDVQYLNEEGTKVKASMSKISLWSDGTPVSGERREVVNETMIFGKIPYHVACATVGNPHYVIFLNEISKDVVCRIRENSGNASYLPKRINTQIMHVVDHRNIEIGTYGHGASYTLTSGSSGCATATAAYKQGLTDSRMRVKIPSGALEIEILDDWTVLMIGDMGFVGAMQLGNTLAEQLRALG